MPEPRDNPTLEHAGRPTRVAWLVLLALATLQLAVAQHASAHALDDLAEPCALCVHLDDLGKVLHTTEPAPPVHGIVALPDVRDRSAGSP
jgi:hypothetical protein